MSKKKISKNNSFPIEGFSSKIKEFFHSFSSSIKSIFYHKRRSMSLIAGLILGIAILSGIFIYSTVLINNVYSSIIAGSPSEIRIDFHGNITDSQIEDFQEMFLDHPKISDAKILYGNGETIVLTSGISTNTFTSAHLEVETDLIDSSFEEPLEGRLIPEDFFSGEIGDIYRQSVISGNVDTFFDTNNGIIIDSSVAERGKLSVGAKINNISLEIAESNLNNPFERITFDSIKLDNLTVIAIIDLSLSASAGIFDIITQTSEIYFSQTLFLSNSSFLTSLISKGMQYSLLKIDESQFSLSNPSEVNKQINQLINEFEEEENISGNNLVSSKLLPFQILSFFVFLFDIILAIPVVILSIYLLSFGIELSLSERGYQIGVLKTQGANTKQIKRKIMGETIILAFVGLLIGYLLAIIGAWIIGTAKGFLSWNYDYAFEKLGDFFIYDQTAFLLVGGAIIVILLVMVNGKSEQYINQEIAESIKKTTQEKKDSWLRRNHFDIIFFGIGVIALIIALSSEYGINLDLGIIQIFISFFGPILFWIGGGSIVYRFIVFFTNRLTPIISTITKDVSLLTKSNVLRKSGDIPKLAIIITLTISFAILANVQGQTGEINQERNIIWNIGGDYVVKTKSIGLTSDNVKAIKEIDKNIDQVMGFLTNIHGSIKNDQINIFSVNIDVYSTVGNWQPDNFKNGNRETILENFKYSKRIGCLVGSSLLNNEALDIGQDVSVIITTLFWDGTYINDTPIFSYGPQNIKLKILGTFDHLPGGIGGNDVVVDHSIINSLYNLTNLSGNIMFESIMINSSTESVLIDNYLVKLSDNLNDGYHLDLQKVILDNDMIQAAKSVKNEIRKENEIQNVDFGIPGLLTANFIVSLLASTLGTYIFMSIIMEKRKKEFAILRSYGASTEQIVKIVFSEILVLLVITITWGLILGINLAYLFNGFFEFLEVWVSPVSSLTSYQIDRILVYDWFRIIITVGVAFFAMIFATFVSIRNALKSNISLELREL